MDTQGIGKTMTADTTTDKVAELREQARQADQARADSFERSDTDGALSQWASGLMAHFYRVQAEVAEDEGKAVFPALFDLDGNLVPAKLVSTRYGMSWGLLSDPDDASSEFTGWFSPSQAQSETIRIRNDARKGYYVGSVRTDAHVDLSGNSGVLSVQVVVFRKDRGWSKDVEILDNGQ